MADGDEALTRLLEAWRQGDAGAGEALAPLIYAELRRMAGAKLRAERPGHTLQPTALVHEAWLRLMQQQRASWRSRTQFFALAAQAMRRILVDHARRRQAVKRGDGAVAVDVDGLVEQLASPLPDARLLAIDAALDRLAVLDEQQARIVELRFFGGLTVEETAEVVGLSPSTIKREWSAARAWLYREVESGR